MQLEELMNKHYKKLNENDFHVLKYILNHQDTCYKLGINELAKKCNVSRTSILRLSQKLDFSGYSEFRVFLKWEAEKREEEREDCRSFECLMRDMEASMKYLKNTDLRKMCQLIDEADRILSMVQVPLRPRALMSCSDVCFSAPLFDGDQRSNRFRPHVS